MMLHRMWHLALLLAAATATLPAQSLRALRAAAPQVKWDTIAVRGDFDGDGKTDEAYLGRANGRVYLGIVVRTAPKPQLLDFAISPSVQQGVCHEPVTLTLEALDYDPGEVGPLPGFRRSKDATGLRLDDDACDAVHLYWDHDAHRMAWWRL